MALTSASLLFRSLWTEYIAWFIVIHYTYSDSRLWCLWLAGDFQLLQLSVIVPMHRIMDNLRPQFHALYIYFHQRSLQMDMLDWVVSKQCHWYTINECVSSVNIPHVCHCSVYVLAQYLSWQLNGHCFCALSVPCTVNSCGHFDSHVFRHRLIARYVLIHSGNDRSTSCSATGTAMGWWVLMFTLMGDDSFFLVNELRNVWVLSVVYDWLPCFVW